MTDRWMRAMQRNDFAAAWSVSDAVLRGRDPASRDDPALPFHLRWVWCGEPLAGREVTVRCYHGLGDTLQFARFLPGLRAVASRVRLEVPRELAPLLSDLADEVIAFDPTAPVEADCAIEIMELQYALRLAVPLPPVLPVRPTPSAGARVGVCWQAGGWDPERSIPLALLRPLLPSGAVSLQRGAVGLPDPLAGAMDVAATAGLIAGLEQVVTVDTMVAHLAGTLGKPVHLLLKAQADWRWGLQQRTPWYPTMQLHRQAHPGEWGAALASLGAALKAGD